MTHTFYNRIDFCKPPFSIVSSVELSMFRAYEHALPNGSELLLMMWNDKAKTAIRIEITSRDYRWPVRISTFNYHVWSEVPCEVRDGRSSLDLEVGPDPVMIRLFHLK